MALSRRKFLALLPAMLLSPSAQSEITREADLFLINLGQWFSDQKALQRVAGAVVEEGNIQDKHLNALAVKLMKLYKAGGESAMRSFLAASIERDFQQENTRVIDGWVLAETEAVISVLASGVRA